MPCSIYMNFAIYFQIEFPNFNAIFQFGNSTWFSWAASPIARRQLRIWVADVPLATLQPSVLASHWPLVVPVVVEVPLVWWWLQWPLARHVVVVGVGQRRWRWLWRQHPRMGVATPQPHYCAPSCVGSGDTAGPRSRGVAGWVVLGDDGTRTECSPVAPLELLPFCSLFALSLFVALSTVTKRNRCCAFITNTTRLLSVNVILHIISVINIDYCLIGA